MLDLLFASPPLFIGGVAALGLLVGSFLNVVILRLPARLEHDWQSQARDVLDIKEEGAKAAPPDLVFTRSHCPHCGHQIRAVENIPLLSYLFLRGRCSSCGSRISPRYPLVEAITGLAFAIVAWHFGPSWQCAAGLLITSFLIVMTGIDLEHKYLFDELTLPLMWVGLLASLWGVFIGPAEAIVGAAFGYLSLWSVFQAFKLITGKEGMGYGDFKLMAALGAWFGWQAVFVIIVLSSFVGAVVGIALIAMRRHEWGRTIPFGPYIAAAGWIYLLWGQEVLQLWFAYLNGRLI